MQSFIPGQRWISEAELNLGLGTVLTVEHRTVTVLFLATGDTRTYSKQTAPLNRVAFGAGDTIQDHQGNQYQVISITEDDGLISYKCTDEQGEQQLVEEGLLDNMIQLSRPTERLFTGQVDHDKWFQLRYQTLEHKNRLGYSELHGLTGARTSLIPHQLYIAHEVANRYAPRVLLADEVGLGKTIEAGLILHHQLLTERAQRVLIVVPETLVHQWLVEMLRRFNLYFSIFDEPRCQAIEEDDRQTNPFETEQLVLCNLDFLVQHPQRLQQALHAEWDLLVVDEAHHLQWHEHRISAEYSAVESLAAATKGVLLLTATPEQLGKDSHFARLRLLDPDRFPDYNSFLEEEDSYQPIADAVEALLENQDLDQQTLATLQATISEGDNQALIDHLDQNQARIELVEHLLDRHGTGRVLFRNTRAAIKGFPGRRVLAHALPCPQQYQACLDAAQSQGSIEVATLLCPELIYQNQTRKNPTAKAQPSWLEFDPRVDWLVDLLNQQHPAKILVIAASADTAKDIAHYLKTQQGIHTAVFHQGLSIVERDRAAAYFADKETGCQVLVCSEIGSEGRNFQFAHQMVLFDCPLNPDLLEQRIGRLDRIGQTETINIHVPYLENTAQDSLYQWYHRGLDAFEHTSPVGHNVFVQLESVLFEQLQNTRPENAPLDELIKHTQTLNHTLTEALHNGRDKLLEYNSCRPHVADNIKQAAQQQDGQSSIYDYMDAIFDCFNIDFEEHSEQCFIIRPSDHMMQNFQGLTEDGMTLTFDRQTALAYEDVHFFSWEHPMVINAMDRVMGNELGNTAVTAVNYQGIKAGSLLLEALYILETTASDALQSSRYLPPTSIRVVIDESANLHTEALSHEFINRHQTLVDTATANKIIRAKQAEIKALVNDSETAAHRLAPQLLKTAQQQTQLTLETEINRLKALKRVNPNVRDEEIDFFDNQWQTLKAVLDSASLRLDALRVIVAT